MISDQTIEKVREVPIADVISRHIDLTRKGSRLFGCCPFHGERTPSLSVSPGNNLWHCFGCHKGGDAIAFVMERDCLTFEDAVTAIAKDHNITIQYVGKEQSDEQRQAASHREHLNKIVETVQKWFEDQLAADSQEAADARAYAASRWSEEYTAELGVGLAPKGSAQFMGWAAKYDIDHEALKELGIIKESKNKPGYIYPMFQERLTIPIRSRSGRVIGWTARYMGDDKTKPKYINSSESTLYSKSASLFGINAAARAARDKEHVIVVEGAPDVMRLQSIGIYNAVAPLGTALTSEHLAQLHKITGALCFIPDNDTQRDPEKLPPGFAAVDINGTRAVADGFFCSVREIPADAGEKQDPDSYITSKEIFDSLKEESYIPWIAAKRFGICSSMAKESKIVADTAALVASVTDRQQRDDICRSLAKIHGRFTLWKAAVDNAMGQEERKKRPASEQLDERTRRFGFIIRDNSYYSVGEDDTEKMRLSNFIMEPLFHIIDPRDATRIFRLKNNRGDSDIVAFKQSELFSGTAFKVRLSSLGRYMWKAKIDKMDNILEYCFDETKSAYPVDKLGWIPKHKMYAFGNGILSSDGQFHTVDNSGIVETSGDKAFFMPAMSDIYAQDSMSYQFEKMFRHDPSAGSAMTLHRYAASLRDVFGEHGMVGFAYLLASLFYDVCYFENEGFPILNLFGQKGTGKTTLACCLQSVYIRFRKPNTLSSMTIPAINDAMTQVANFLTVIDEYKNDIHPKKIDFLKSIFDGSGQAKKNMDGDKKTYKSEVTGALALCGQDMPTQDMALLSRLVFLHLTNTSFTTEQQRKADEFIDACRKGHTHIAVEILRHRERFEQEFPELFQIVKDDIRDRTEHSIMTRVHNSWAIILAALRTLEPVIDIPFTYEDTIKAAMPMIEAQNAYLEDNSELADFWKTFNGLFQQGRIIDRAHFRLRSLSKFRNSGGSVRDFGRSHEILYLNPTAISLLFGRQAGGSATANRSNWSTIEAYLKGESYYLGASQDRFMILRQNGEPDKAYTKDKRSCVKYNRPYALCFDYEQLQRKYGVELRTELADSYDKDFSDEQEEQPEDPFADIFNQSPNNTAI